MTKRNNPDNPVTALGIEIRTKREILGWSQMDAAKALNISQPTISHIENGTRLPSISLLLKIAQVFFEFDSIQIQRTNKSFTISMGSSKEKEQEIPINCQREPSFCLFDLLTTTHQILHSKYKIKSPDSSTKNPSSRRITS